MKEMPCHLYICIAVWSSACASQRHILYVHARTIFNVSFVTDREYAVKSFDSTHFLTRQNVCRQYYGIIKEFWCGFYPVYWFRSLSVAMVSTEIHPSAIRDVTQKCNKISWWIALEILAVSLIPRYIIII